MSAGIVVRRVEILAEKHGACPVTSVTVSSCLLDASRKIFGLPNGFVFVTTVAQSSSGRPVTMHPRTCHLLNQMRKASLNEPLCAQACLHAANKPSHFETMFTALEPANMFGKKKSSTSSVSQQKYSSGFQMPDRLLTVFPGVNTITTKTYLAIMGVFVIFLCRISLRCRQKTSNVGREGREVSGVRGILT